MASAGPGWRQRLRAHVRDPVYGNGYALVLNSGAGAILGFGFWMVAARLFSAEDLGWGAAVVSAATLAALLGKAGFDAAVIRFVPHVHARYARKLVAYTIVAAMTLTLIACLALFALAGSGIASLSALRTPLAAAGFIALACGTSAAWMLDAFYIAKQEARLTLLRNLAFHGVKLVAPLLVAVWLVPLSDFAVPIAWTAGLAASLVVATAFLPGRLKAGVATQTERPSRKDVAGYSAKNYVLNLAEFMPGLVLPILVLEHMGAEANASFFLAWTIATVAFLASKAIAQSAFAELVRRESPGPALRKALLLSTIVLAPGMLVMLGGAPFVLRLFGPQYAGESAELLRLLALSIPPIAVSNVYLAYLKARRAGWELTLLPAVTLLTLLVALPLALPIAGIVGVGVVWLGVQTLAGAYAAARLVAAVRRTPHGTLGNPLGHRAHEG